MVRPFKSKEVIIDFRRRYTVTKDHLPYAPFEEFLKHQLAKSKGDGENTSKAYSRNLSEFGNFLHIHGYDWWDVHSGIVSSYVEWVKRNGPKLTNVIKIRRKSDDSAYAPRSINQRTAAIIACFEYHKRIGKFVGVDLRTYKNTPPHDDEYKHEYNQIKSKRGARPSNPWNQKVKKVRVPILEPDEVEFLVNSVTYLRDKLLITIMYDVGLRIGEALGLRISDIDPHEGTVKVVRRHNENNAKVKGDSEREGLQLSNKGMALFTQYLLEEYPEEIDSDYLFVVIRDCSTRGNAYNYSAAYNMITRLRPKFKKHFGHDRPFTLHWLRHSAGTDLMENDNTGGRAVQEILGHAHLQSTGKYVHPRKENQKERMKAIHIRREESAKKRKRNSGEDDV